MLNDTISLDHTMRELFEFPDATIPFVVWTGDFSSLLDRRLTLHWHHEFEYCVLLKGTLDFCIDGQTIRLQQGDCVFVNTNSMHMATQVGQEDVLLFTVSFLPSLFVGGTDGTIYKKYFQPLIQSSIRGFAIEHNTKDGERIIQQLNEIYEDDTEQTEQYELLCISAICKIWLLTLSYIKEQKNHFLSFAADRKTERRAKSILSYIHAHYVENIQIEEIAKHTYISRSELFRCFQKYTDRSPMEYLTEYRLAYATKLLTESDLSITQIAVECGFSNSSYFGKVFKKKYGVSPSDFQKPRAVRVPVESRQHSNEQ